MPTENKTWTERLREIRNAEMAAEYSLVCEAVFLATLFKDDPRLHILREKVARWKQVKEEDNALSAELLKDMRKAISDAGATHGS